MATTAIPIPPQTPPVPSISTIDVGKLGGETPTLKPSSAGCMAGATSAHIRTPQFQYEPEEADLTPETQALITTVLTVGGEWQSKRKTVKDYFEQHKLEVLKLRNAFGVKPGSKGKTLSVPNPNGGVEPMYWSDFVSLAFGVSDRHINRLLGINEPPNPLDPSKSKNYKLGFVAGQEAALRGHVQAPAVAKPLSKLDKGDPYAYFEQLKDEKQTFASELAAMVVEMFEPTDTDEIVQEFGKEVKRQQQLRNAEAARNDLDKLAEKESQQTKAGAKNTALTKNEPSTKATKKFLVARIGDTQEFGVFPDWCADHSAANALTIGTKQACEAERDRLNTKRAAKAESDSTLPGATNTQVPQMAVSVQ